MNWAAVDSRFHSHRKVLEIRQHTHGLSAIALWVLSMAWCADQQRNHLTGRVPRHVASHLLGEDATSLAQILVDVGLWEVDSEGWVFHDWDDWNGIGGHELRSKEATRERKARQRLHNCELGNHSKDCPTRTLDDDPWICPARAKRIADKERNVQRHTASRDADTKRNDTKRNDAITNTNTKEMVLVADELVTTGGVVAESSVCAECQEPSGSNTVCSRCEEVR